MPYTPPSHRSPASSAPSSPDASRRPSLATGGNRPSLPRSASYLTRHRRTPSASATTLASNNGNPPYQPTPEATSEDLKSMVASSLSVRKSPPPVTDDRGMPSGAIISPPESLASSDDDDLPEIRSKRLDITKQLHAAISQIPQHRESSPTRSPHDDSSAPPKLVIPSPSSPGEAGEAGGMHVSFSTGSLGNLASTAGRRISHTRSATDSDLLVTQSADNSLTGSDADSEEEVMMKKPQMVRKKSGELVRPALRPASRRRPSSMPGTPTFSKAVHFDSHLEHVRHFLQVDRPLAVSAGSSPADNYGSDGEYPFPQNGDFKELRAPPFEWEITVTNFPVETPGRKALHVRLERVWLSSDQKCLTGSVDVANLAFQKYVTCRFTFDYWKTTSEVAAEYSAEIRPKEGGTTSQDGMGHDRFNFTIKLSEVANLESKTLYFCIRYNVNGQELWDNNGGTNFQVDFRKKMLPQNGKRGFQGVSARPAGGELPRSTRRANPSTAPRPKSMPGAVVGLGKGSASEFGENSGASLNFDQSIHDYLGEGPTSLRLKGSKSTTSLPSDNLPGRLAPPSGQAFANRYDFGASLSTAIQAAKNALPKSSGPAVGNDGLYMKPNTKAAAAGAKQPAPTQHSKPTFLESAPIPVASPLISPKSTVPSSTTGNIANSAKSMTTEDHSTTTANQTSASANNQSVPPVSPPSGPSSMSSASYEELVSKYCFFGSKQSSPQLKDGTARTGRFDGPDDSDFVARVGGGSGSLTSSLTSSNNSSADSSLMGSPLQMSALGGRNYLAQQAQPHQQPVHQLQSVHGAQHHSLRKDQNPYFQHASLTTGYAPAPGSPRSPLLHSAMMEHQQQQQLQHQQHRAPSPTLSRSTLNTPTAHAASTATAAPQPVGNNNTAAASAAASTGRSPSPTVVGFHHHRAAEYPPYQQHPQQHQPRRHHGRFPFHAGPETHASPAIRG